MEHHSECKEEEEDVKLNNWSYSGRSTKLKLNLQRTLEEPTSSKGRWEGARARCIDRLQKFDRLWWIECLTEGSHYRWTHCTVESARPIYNRYNLTRRRTQNHTTLQCNGRVVLFVNLQRSSQKKYPLQVPSTGEVKGGRQRKYNLTKRKSVILWLLQVDKKYKADIYVLICL